MIQDPYQVFGLQHGASQEEIKKAYRRMAKLHHPDLHPDDPNATKRMNEINEAYDMLTNPDKYAAQQARSQYGETHQQQRSNTSGGYGQYREQRSYGGWTSDSDFNFEDIFGFDFSGQPASTHPQAQPGDSTEIRRAIDYINNGRPQEAIRVLTYIPSMQRDARWYYLSALANHALGNSVQALDQIQKAAQMDPQNRTYNQLLRQLRQAGQTYEHNAQGFDMHAVNLDKICLGLCFMQLFCGGVPCIRCY